MRAKREQLMPRNPLAKPYIRDSSFGPKFNEVGPPTIDYIRWLANTVRDKEGTGIARELIHNCTGQLNLAGVPSYMYGDLIDALKTRLGMVPPPPPPPTLIERIRESIRLGLDKSTIYEAIDNDFDRAQYIDDQINYMSNVELLETISWLSSS
jgi:hypothetical protein